MLSVEAAIERILTGLEPLPAETVRLDEALGRVAAERVTAAVAVPPFANSSMDGFAVRAADLPGSLKVVGEVRAGGVPAATLEAGTAVRIMTGAPLPEGADAVVPLERAREADGRVDFDGTLPAPGAYVRRAGEDTRPGDEILADGDPLTPARIAVLASCGHARVAVRRRPAVAILSTGDELVPPREPLTPGRIYDANAPALAAAVREAGGEPRVLAAVGDDEAAIERRLAEGAAAADVVVTSGGVSVGAHDHVRNALERLGALDFWRINVQPGKPLAFGRVLGRPVVGLPGNPVSALITFELFVRPMLRRLLGARGDGRSRLVVRLTAPMPKDPSRRAYLRVRVCASDSGYVAVPAGGQSSGQLRPLADANALLVVPEGDAEAVAGRTYPAVLIGPLE